MDTQAVTDPGHYDIHVAGHSCEVYDLQRALLDRWELSAFAGHCLATAIKYIYRCGHKGGVGDAIKDLGKALFYVALALAELNHGSLPIQLLERLRRMAPEFPLPGETSRAKVDLFDPVDPVDPVDEGECKDGFCPIRKPAYDVNNEQGVHPAARLVENLRQSDIISAEKEREILDRKW